MPTPVYHITHVKNLMTILATEGLRSYNGIQSHNLSVSNIAHSHIQDRRAKKSLKYGAGGTLHDYVPFYFAPRSPMLYTINQGNVSDHSEGQTPVVHLAASAQAIRAAGHSFVFTDGHGTMQITQFFDNLADLDKVDWQIMKAKYWKDIDIDNDRKRRRQAEFLVHEVFPLVTYHRNWRY